MTIQGILAGPIGGSGESMWRRLVAGLKNLLWYRSDRRLPERVQQSIRREEEASEILVSWVQMGIVLVFGTVYTLAPKTFSSEAPFQPVPVVLGTYFLFVVVRIILGHRRRLAT